jgi:hypothetical protein
MGAWRILILPSSPQRARFSHTSSPLHGGGRSNRLHALAYPVERSTQWAVLITLVGIVALALSAATLPSTVPSENTGPDGANATGSGVLPSPEGPEPSTLDIDAPTWLLPILFGTVLLAGLVYFLSNPKEAITNAVVVVAVMGGVFVVLYLLAGLLDSLQGGDGIGDGLFGQEGGRPQGGEVDPAALDPSMLLVAVVVGFVLVAAAATLYGATGDAADEVEDAGPVEESDGGAVASVGRAAGRAADRIESATDTDNEVYRAWQEMADRLELERPETSTPGEFEAAAVDAGMERGDVSELTRLFEEVRYGDATPTEEREQRAAETLRRIEETYTREGDDPWQ